MPMRRTKMIKVREILRYKEQSHFSERAISRALNISRPVVKQYLTLFEKSGLDYEAIQQMDDDILLEVLSDKSPAMSPRLQTLTDQFEYFIKELKRPGVTLQRLWEEYIVQHPDGFQYSQFCYHFQRWRDALDVSMPIEHKAGDKMFVDFTGQKLHIVDRETGEEIPVEVFVAILGASQRTYVQATLTQSQSDWIQANQNAFIYFHGVTKAIAPDCLKAAVTRGCKYEPDINPQYFDFARHYHTTILPARPHHPKDKALVEGAVRIVYAWIFAALRNTFFHSLEDLNRAIARELELYNARPMQRLKVSRNDLFEQIEKAALLPLPRERYMLRNFKTATVQFNYHVYLPEDKHYYSVPYRLKGKKVTVIYNDTTVEIYSQYLRVALHKRAHGSLSRYSTLKEHMPPAHQYLSDWTPQKFISWAQKMGDYVTSVIEAILARPAHPEQSYKVCLGILNLEKHYSKERLNKACQRAMEFQNFSYRGIKRILENKMENIQLDCFELPQDHANLRGKQYYQ